MRTASSFALIRNRWTHVDAPFSLNFICTIASSIASNLICFAKRSSFRGEIGCALDAALSCARQLSLLEQDSAARLFLPVYVGPMFELLYLGC